METVFANSVSLLFLVRHERRSGSIDPGELARVTSRGLLS